MSNVSYPLIPTQVERSWLERHPRWKIPLGALIILVLICAFVTGLMAIIFTSFHSSDVYKQALAQAGSNVHVQQFLGEPIKAGWLITGQLSVNGSSGSANLSIPISGPKGKGAIHAVAMKSAATWRFSELEVSVEGQAESIDLLSAQPST